MELYVMDNVFNRTRILDEFVSLIWTERYYGDSEFQFVVVADSENIQTLTPGTLIISDDSLEVMMIDTQDIESQTITIAGTSMVQWLRNRFIRFTKNAADQNFNIRGRRPAYLICYIVQEMCMQSSRILNLDDSDDEMGISYGDRQRFIIPSLQLGDYYTGGDFVDMSIPYGPVYDAISSIAQTYQIGMQWQLDVLNDRHLFRSYKGQDRTSTQKFNGVVRFSPKTDTFANSKEIVSNKDYKNIAYVWSNSVPRDVGKSELDVQSYGLDLRAAIKIDDQVTGDVNILNHTAKNILTTNDIVKAIDGQILLGQFTYGADYGLGDIVEVEGVSGIINSAMITEHILSQDATGTREYPTVQIVNPLTASQTTADAPMT